MVFDYKKQYHLYKNYFHKLKEIADKPAARLSFALMLTFFTISFFGIFALKPTFTTIAKLIKDIKDNQELNVKLQEKIKNLEQAQLVYEEIKPNLVYLDKALPKDAEFNNLLSKINYLVYTNNLTLNDANFSGFTLYPVEPNLVSLKLTLDIIGDYANIKLLIDDIHNLDRLIKINSIIFNPDNKNTQSLINVTLNAEVFWFAILKD